MGLLDKVLGELIDIVEWIDDDRHTLVWRFPRYHNQMKNGAQLIVRPGQLAVLVDRGRIADVFAPGQHTLATANLPILSTLQGWKYGFDSPFKAEVYFVSTRLVTDLKWGTPNPVIIRDPDFGPIRVRAFGTYVLRATDPRVLVQQLVGTDAQLGVDEIGVLLRSIIASAFAELVATAGVSVVDLASRTAELSERLRALVVSRVDDELGLDVPQLYLVNVSLPEELERALDARTGMGMVGDLVAYQQYQLGRAIPVAAENPAGGLAAAGVGLGMGVAYAGTMLPGHGPTTPPPAPPVAWHVLVHGERRGPFPMAELTAMVRDGRLHEASLVWTAGMAGWEPAGRVGPLTGLFPPAAPPPP